MLMQIILPEEGAADVETVSRIKGRRMGTELRRNCTKMAFLYLVLCIKINKF